MPAGVVDEPWGNVHYMTMPPEEFHRSWQSALWPAAFLLLLPIIGHLPELAGWVDTYPLLFMSSLTEHRQSGLLPGVPFIDGNAAQTMLALGHLSAESWLNLRLPWWNPFTGVGLPLASEMQPASFFMPFVLLLHFHSGVLLLKIVMQMMAGLACFAFLRQIGLRQGSSLAAAVLFQFNGTFAWYADAPMLPQAFLPALLLGLERARDCAVARRRGGQILIALAIAYSLVAGFPETAFLDGLLALGWALVRVNGLERAFIFSFGGKIVVGGMFGLALASPVLLPFLFDLRVSTLGPHTLGAGLPLDPSNLAALLFPNVYGPPYADGEFAFWVKMGGYVGAVPCLLAIMALLASGGPRGARQYLAGWAVIWTSAAFGLPGFSQLVRLIPGVEMIQLCRYCMPSVEFAVCVLAGFAVNDFLCRGVRRQALSGLCILVGISLIALWLGRHRLQVDATILPASVYWATISITGGCGLALALALLLRTPATPWRKAVLVGLPIFEALASATPTTFAGLTKPGLNLGPIAFLQAHQGFQRSLSVDMSIPPNVGALYGIGNLTYEYIPVAKTWAAYVRSKVDPYASEVSFPFFEAVAAFANTVGRHQAAIEALGVRYVVTPTNLNPFASATGAHQPVRVFSQNGTDIWDLPAALPYAETQGGTCQLQVLDREHMTADCNGAATLIRRELMFPDWSARVNQRRVTVATIEDIFQTITLPAGQSVITWRYVPDHANTIALCFSAGLLGVTTCLCRKRPSNLTRTVTTEA